MKKFWCIVFFSILCYQCESDKAKSSNPLSLVPDDTEILIKINAAEGLESGLKNNALIKAFQKYPQIKNFTNLLAPLHHINKDGNLIALSKGADNDLKMCLIVPFHNQQTNNDALPEFKIDSTFSNTYGVKRFTYKDSTFYSALIDSTLFISNQMELAQTAFGDNTLDEDLNAIYSTSDSEKMVSVLINHKKGYFKPLIFEDSILNHQKFSNYTMVDSDISQNAILISGITKATDSSESLINIFKNTIPQENRMATLLPPDTDYFKSMTFHDYSLFRQNMIAHQFQDSISADSYKFQNIVEFGQASINDKQGIFLRSIDPTATFEAIEEAMSIADDYRNVTIYQIDDTLTQLSSFSPLLSDVNASYGIAIDDFLVFANDLSFLESIISSYQNNSVLAKTDAYENLKLNLSDEASLLIFRNARTLNNSLNTNFTNDLKLDMSDFRSSAIQYIFDTDFAHVNAVFKTHKRKSAHNTVSEELNITLDADLITRPQLVRNHTNSQMDIAVQDINNNLYLISNKGKVFWKKQLDGKIMGDIKQIDTYKNGRLQLVFNTTKRLYVLDRNGNDVKPFPLKFNDDITQPVSVFDYDNKKNYRLLITQGKSVLMYDKQGKIVNGFTYKTAQNDISSQPKHFRIGRKDFITFTHGNKIEILNRVGKTRVNVKENISFSNNNIYLYNNKFTTSSTNGELIEINQSGKVNHKNLNANSEHKIATTSRTLVVLNDNKLTIKSKTITLDFGDYTAPKIFYINDKIYVTVTDLQSKKGYLFDSQAKSIANFPVYANSQLELGNIDKDSALEVITKGDNDAIIVYEIR